MSDYPLIIIGAGLSGLAAGIRFARFGQPVLILEQHSKPGGLNSYYHRQGRLLETGLHAITNYAAPGERRAPLSILCRQLKLPRRHLQPHQQKYSRVIFTGLESLSFSNDFRLLHDEIARAFPGSATAFQRLVSRLDEFDPFRPRPYRGTRSILAESLPDPLLTEMLLCPLLFYGGSSEHDLDFSQFVIMFRAIFQEGLWRPAGTIRDFLDRLLEQYHSFGGEIRFRSGVAGLLTDETSPVPRIRGVRLADGTEITARAVLSTIGYPVETGALLPRDHRPTPPATNGVEPRPRLSFIESIYLLSQTANSSGEPTTIFYNEGERFLYQRPTEAADLASGVICFPANFQDLPTGAQPQLRVTHLANYRFWADVRQRDENEYRDLKEAWSRRSRQRIWKIIGNYQENIVYEDSFTPATIYRFTGKAEGAVYGCPQKKKDGSTPISNLFIAGTDQGYLGIVGAMLSGVTIVNRHILRQNFQES